MPNSAALYARRLVLVRPDRHVAWRADVEPDDALGLIDHLRGAGVASMREPQPGASRYVPATPPPAAGGAELMKPPDCRRHSSA